MKKLSKILLWVLVVSLSLTLLAACDTDPCKQGHKFSQSDGKCTVCGKLKCDVDGHTWINAECKFCDAEYELVDYVSQLKLDMNSETKKAHGNDIIIRYVDGDTTHFRVGGFVDNTLKARYLAVNTPESTGTVEPYGKVASNFTMDRLQGAIDNGGEVLVESDKDEWEADSYGRTLAWVWYKPDANSDWRNLNLELLQNGLGIGSDAGSNRYGETCLAAMDQALQARLIVHSGEKDETFYYGDAQEITLRELRTNLTKYQNQKVAFEGTVTLLSGSGGSYVEDYDSETGISYGIYVYFGTVKIAKVLEILGKPGNRVRVVGTVTALPGSDVWQVSGVNYRMSKPDDPGNVQLIEDYEGEDHTFQKFTVSEFFDNKTVPVLNHDSGEFEDKSFKLCSMLFYTSITMENLVVVSAHTTDNGGSNDGAISLTCKDAAGNEITVRTAVLYKDGVLVTQDEFVGKTINVKGIVDYYSDFDQYQIKVLSYDHITIVP